MKQLHFSIYIQIARSEKIIETRILLSAYSYNNYSMPF